MTWRRDGFEARPSNDFERPIAAERAGGVISNQMCEKSTLVHCFVCCRIQRSLLERQFRALSGFGARPGSDFERPSGCRARPGDIEYNVLKSNASAVFSSAADENEACWSSDFAR